MNYMGLFDIFKKKPQLTEEQLKWNKMWDLWVEKKVDSPYAELMTYQSGVNNGGHDQYFTNVENTSDLEKEMSALEKILSAKLKANLKKAYKAYRVLEEKEEDEKSKEILEQCDDVFWEYEKRLTMFLKNTLLKFNFNCAVSPSRALTRSARLFYFFLKIPKNFKKHYLIRTLFVRVSN